MITKSWTYRFLWKQNKVIASIAQITAKAAVNPAIREVFDSDSLPSSKVSDKPSPLVMEVGSVFSWEPSLLSLVEDISWVVSSLDDVVVTLSLTMFVWVEARVLLVVVLAAVLRKVAYFYVCGIYAIYCYLRACQHLFH